MFKLVISDDEGKTTVVPLVRDEITIGRREGNTIQLTDRNVSRRHARLRRKNGAFIVEDLGSYNGVRINGLRIDAEGVVGAGDKVDIGDYELALERDDEDDRSGAGPDSSGETALAEPVPPARLVMLTAPAPGAEFALREAEVRVGRSEDLDVWVNHRSISREHARLSRERGAFVVRDLGSANGVRLNGAELREATLEPGDILELGQVRFRFVGEGETYVYDAADARRVGERRAPPRTRRARALAAAVFIGAAAVAAVAAMTAGEAPAPPTAHAPPVQPSERRATTANEDAASRAAEAVKSCQAAVSERRFEDALRLAADALAANSADRSAATCRAAAEAGIGEAEAFARGAAALRAGDLEAAYSAFEELPPKSPFRAETSVEAARARFVARRLELARRSLGPDPAEAVRQANVVLGVEGLGDAERRRAESIVARAQRRALAPPPSRASARAESGRSHSGADVAHPVGREDAYAADEGAQRSPSSSAGGEGEGLGATLSSPSAGAALADDRVLPVPLD